MPRRPRKSQKTTTKTGGFVIAAFAESFEQAREYESLLKAEDIPAVIEQRQSDDEPAKCFAVMVSEEKLDEAHVVIESQDAYDDFYDFVLEQDDGQAGDPEFFEENF